MRLPNNLSAKEKKEWITKYKNMGIKIDETPEPSIKSHHSFMDAGFEESHGFGYSTPQIRKTRISIDDSPVGSWTNDIEGIEAEFYID